MVTPNSDNNNQKPLYISEINDMSFLEETVREIKQNDKNGLGNVIAITQFVDERIKEYQEERDNFYKILFPVPWIILREIEGKLKENKATKPLLKYLYKSWKLKLCYIIYPCSMGGSIITFLLLLMLVRTGELIVFVMICVMICFVFILFRCQIRVFDDTIQRIVFTKMYQDICQVIDKILKEHLDFFAKVVSIPMMKEDIRINKELEEFDERLELEKRRSLQGLGAAIALAQADTDKQRDMILSEPKLQIHKDDQAHEIALKELEIQGQLLIEERKIVVESLGKDHERAKELEYQLKLTQNFKETIMQNGDEALKTPEAQKTWENIMNRKPKKAS